MNNMKFCQSCAMPLTAPDQYGKEADGTANADYCAYCYKDGKFTADCTMQEMIDFCVPHTVAAHPGTTEEQARAQMAAYYPQLKRWK